MVFFATIQRIRISCAITWSLYINGNQQIPLAFDIYLKQGVAEDLGMKFKTKIDIALKLLDKCLNIVDPSVIVYDSWYFCKQIVDYLDSKKKSWVTMAKCNRDILGNGSS